MALSLKTSGIATALVMCLAVDDDGTTIKEFVSTDVDSNKTIDAAVTTGSSTWKGTARGYFQTLVNGDFNFKGINFASGHRPVMDDKDTDGVSWFIALAGSGVAKGVSIAINGSGMSPGQYTTVKASLYAGSFKGQSTTTLPNDGTTKYSVGWNHQNTSGAAFYYGLESGSLAADGTTTGDAGFGSNTDSIASVGGWAGQGNWPAKYHIACAFNRQLTLTEMQSLHNDWFGTLFDSGSTTVDATLAATDAPDVAAFAASTYADTVSATLDATDAPDVAAFALTQLVAGTITTSPLKNNTGTLLADETGATAFVYDVTTGELVVALTGQTTDGSAVMTLADVLLESGATHRVVIVLASGAEGMETLEVA